MREAFKKGDKVRLSADVSEKRAKMFGKEIDHADLTEAKELTLTVEESDSYDRNTNEEIYRVSGCNVPHFGNDVPIYELLFPVSSLVKI